LRVLVIWTGQDAWTPDDQHLVSYGLWEVGQFAGGANFSQLLHYHPQRLNTLALLWLCRK